MHCWQPRVKQSAFKSLISADLNAIALLYYSGFRITLFRSLMLCYELFDKRGYTLGHPQVQLILLFWSCALFNTNPGDIKLDKNDAASFKQHLDTHLKRIPDIPPPPATLPATETISWSGDIAREIC